VQDLWQEVQAIVSSVDTRESALRRTAVPVSSVREELQVQDVAQIAYLMRAYERASVCLPHLRQALQSDEPSGWSCRCARHSNALQMRLLRPPVQSILRTEEAYASPYEEQRVEKNIKSFWHRINILSQDPNGIYEELIKKDY